MSDSKPTAWMWRDEESNAVQGVSVNLERGTMQWYHSPGCACSTSSEAEQFITDFLRDGPRFLNPPDDVMAEMTAALQAYTTKTQT